MPSGDKLRPRPEISRDLVRRGRFLGAVNQALVQLEALYG
jgi:hypothetical protein